MPAVFRLSIKRSLQERIAIQTLGSPTERARSNDLQLPRFVPSHARQERGSNAHHQHLCYARVRLRGDSRQFRIRRFYKTTALKQCELVQTLNRDAKPPYTHHEPHALYFSYRMPDLQRNFALHSSGSWDPELGESQV